MLIPSQYPQHKILSYIYILLYISLFHGNLTLSLSLKKILNIISQNILTKDYINFIDI